jgi:SAM-dependent methyltransferase
VKGEEYSRHYRERRFRTFWGRRTGARESRLLAELLARLEGGSGPWLDVPCGAGRLTPLLPQEPPPVGCDLSYFMAAAAEIPGGRVQGSALALPFRDGSFAGCLCFRLLHHLAGPEERIRVLGELARVSRRWVVVSFFHSWSLQDLRRRVRHHLLGRRRGRRSVSWRRLRAEAAAAGLEPLAVRPLRRFVSEQWLALLRKG